MSKGSGTSGFTLVEVLAILFIISLLVTLSLPPVTAFVRQLEFRSCLRQTSQLFRQGQMLSKERYIPHRIIQQKKKLVLQSRNSSGWEDTCHHYTVKPGIVLLVNQSPIFYPSGAIVPLCSVNVIQTKRKCRLTISAAGRIRLQNLEE